MRFFNRGLPKTEPAQPSQSERDTTREIPIGHKLPIEITRIKKKADEAQGKRVVIQTARIKWRGVKATFYRRGKALHFIDTEGLIWNPVIKKKSLFSSEKVDRGYWKLQFDEHLCEHLGLDGKAKRSETVSRILRDEWADEIVQIAQKIFPIEFTRTLVIVMIVVGALVFISGLTFNSIFHTAPTTEIHWVTSQPK